MTFGKTLIYWIPPVLWMLFICPLNNLLTSQGTSFLILPLLSWVLPDATPETSAGLHIAFRKSGHFLGYAILAFLVFRAFRRAETTFRFSWVLFAGLISLGYAALDEYLQTFINSRTGSVWDWAIDSLGIASAMTILLWRNKKPRSQIHP